MFCVNGGYTNKRDWKLNFFQRLEDVTWGKEISKIWSLIYSYKNGYLQLIIHSKLFVLIFSVMEMFAKIMFKICFKVIFSSFKIFTHIFHTNSEIILDEHKDRWKELINVKKQKEMTAKIMILNCFLKMKDDSDVNKRV